jgi:hypothetical protein
MVRWTPVYSHRSTHSPNYLDNRWWW